MRRDPLSARSRKKRPVAPSTLRGGVRTEPPFGALVANARPMSNAMQKAQNTNMNKYTTAVALAVFGALVIAFSMELRYSHAFLLFGLIAALSAPVVIHKTPNASWASGGLMGLAFFASSPFKKLFQIDSFINEVAVTLAYAALLWAIGFGWKRSWR